MHLQNTRPLDRPEASGRPPRDRFGLGHPAEIAACRALPSPCAQPTNDRLLDLDSVATSRPPRGIPPENVQRHVTGNI